MDNRSLPVPVSGLLDPRLTAVQKILWIALRQDPAASTVKLQRLTGLSRTSIRRGRTALSSIRRTSNGIQVKLPTALLGETSLSAQAKVLYALLQFTPGFKGFGGQCTYRSLHSLTGLGPKAARRAITELAEANWIQHSQQNRSSPIQFRIGTPQSRLDQEQAAQARQRLRHSLHKGEALMQEYLSLLIDSKRFTDNAWPDFLINPLTGEGLQFDRYYPPKVAFEFHGSQHDYQTERYSQQEVDAQQVRDLLKAGICLYRGIDLVIIRAEDLSLQGMRKKVGNRLPLRDLHGQEFLIDLLEEFSILYQASVPRQPDGFNLGAPTG